MGLSLRLEQLLPLFFLFLDQTFESLIVLHLFKLLLLKLEAVVELLLKLARFLSFFLFLFVLTVLDNDVLHLTDFVLRYHFLTDISYLVSCHQVTDFWLC